MTLSLRTRLAVALAVTVLTSLALGGTASAQTHGFALGKTLQHPVGVAQTRDRFLITQECIQDVMSLEPDGSTRVFATLPPNPGCPNVEDYIAAVPQNASSQWNTNDAYVIEGNKVYRLQRNGRVSRFTTGPCTADTQAAIAFDRVGTWGGGLIVICGSRVYTIDAAGRIAYRATTPDLYAEGPDVAPLSFPQYGGWLFVAEEFANQVAAISPTTGEHVVVGQWPDAEHVRFVPNQVCTYGSTGAAYVAGNPFSTGGRLWAYPAADFAGLAGKAIVAAEDNVGLGILYGPGDIRTFDASNDSTFEGASFANWSTRCQ